MRQSPPFTMWPLLLLLLPGVLLHPSGSHEDIQFDRSVTGVVFSPYVHQSVPEKKEDDWSTYTLEDIKTMMRVVHTRFSKIATVGVGANTGQGQGNYSEALAAEAAAWVNMESSTDRFTKRVPISLFVGVEVHRDPKLLQQEVRLAKQSALVANKIFPSTVSGLVFTRPGKPCHSCSTDREDYVEATWAKMKEIKREDRTLKLGSRQNCTAMFSTADRSRPYNGDRELISVSDFIVCEFYPGVGLKLNWEQVHRDFEKFTREFQRVNPALEIVAQTGISARAGNQYEVQALQDYWQEVENFAKKQKLSGIWMQEAIGNPWKKQGEAEMGWWRSESDNHLRDEHNYEEKVAILESRGSTTTIKPSTTTRPVSHKPGPGTSGAVSQYFATGNPFAGSTMLSVALMIAMARFIES